MSYIMKARDSSVYKAADFAYFFHLSAIALSPCFFLYKPQANVTH